MDPSDPRVIYAGTISWQPASPTWSSRVSAVAVAPGSGGNRVAVGHEDGFVHFTDQALTAGAATTWGEAKPRDGFVSWIDPKDPLRVYATYATFGGQHVWASDDGGATWRPIDGDGPGRLPNTCLPLPTAVGLGEWKSGAPEKKMKKSSRRVSLFGPRSRVYILNGATIRRFSSLSRILLPVA
jgi:hypothetical protein